MHSDLPKPLHPIAGRAMVLHVLDALAELGADEVVVVVGHLSAQVTAVIEARAPEGLLVHFVEQAHRRGTADATAVGFTGFDRELDLEEGDLLVLPGDTPLIRAETLDRLVAEHREHRYAATVLSAVMADPTGYGRILRGRNGRVSAIVEERDASESERGIDEVNTSIYCFDQTLLAPAMRRIGAHNAQGEYYLTDVIAILAEAGHAIGSHVIADALEVAGVNDRAQLSEAQTTMRRRINLHWMHHGVTMIDPDSVAIDLSVTIGRDVTLLPGVILEGSTTIGTGATIGPSTHLIDTLVGERARLRSVEASGARIGHDADVGPFALVTEGTHIADGTVTGPFFGAWSQG